MLIYDPLYGQFETPDFLEPFLFTPEVRRLSQVRLLNTLSPSVTTLGELRRYSHTLGVLYLCSQSKLGNFSVEERQAFAVAVILHDIGTPPFGHLMEYHLNEANGWNHEKEILKFLWATHAPENRAHQIFRGRIVELQQVILNSGIPLKTIEDIVVGKHPLHSLLFGGLDFDNLDNVARMAWALGMPGGPDVAVELARHLQVDCSGRIHLVKSDGLHAVRQWARLRRAVYEVLVFDPIHTAAQAVLSNSIKSALMAGEICGDDWLSDESLLERLQRFTETKKDITHSYFGRVPALVFAIQVQGTLSSLDIDSRECAQGAIEETLGAEFKGDKGLGYIQIDSGTFEKHLVFVNSDGTQWNEGNKSQSVILYGFLRSSAIPMPKRCRHVVATLLKRLNISRDIVCRVQIGSPTLLKNDKQIAFDLPA